MKIGLMGFEFSSPNKGCEALSYAFVSFLSENYNDIEIYVWDTELGELPGLFQNIEFHKISSRLKDPKFTWIRLLTKLDAVYDVTMGDSFSDIYSEKYCSKLIRKKTIVEFFSKQYVLMPQTYGPFNNKVIREKAIKVINHANIVISRDKASIDYLRSLGVKREIKEHIDLAFLLPYNKEKYNIQSEKKNIGINISGLLWKGGFNNNNQFGLTIDYKKYIYSLLDALTMQNDWKIHIVPHVIDLRDNAHDDDYKISMMIHESYPQTILAPAFSNPIDAKSYISNMDCFIGSRMHSTVAALSSGVPVIPVSYSRKFEGLFDEFDYKYLIHGRDDNTEEAVRRTIEYAENYNILKSIISNDVHKQISKAVSSLESTMMSILDKNRR